MPKTRGIREKGLKIGVGGKGGVGKTTVTALLAGAAVHAGRRVVVVDADPNPTLAITLGYSQPITPLLENAELIEERVGQGGLITLNPAVDDLLSQFGVQHEGLTILVLGGIRGGGQGCACPASALLRAILQHLVLSSEETVFVDLEAGVEPFGRATAQALDALLLVTDSDRRSLDTVRRVLGLAQEIGLSRVYAVGNKVGDQEELEFIRQALPPQLPFLGAIPFSARIKEGGCRGALPKDTIPEAEKIWARLCDPMALEEGDILLGDA